MNHQAIKIQTRRRKNKADFLLNVFKEVSFHMALHYLSSNIKPAFLRGFHCSQTYKYIFWLMWEFHFHFTVGLNHIQYRKEFLFWIVVVQQHVFKHSVNCNTAVETVSLKKQKNKNMSELWNIWPFKWPTVPLQCLHSTFQNNTNDIKSCLAAQVLCSSCSGMLIHKHTDKIQKDL